jgi:hypothetical protein
MSKAEEYSFNIPSELFQQLTKEQQVLWRKEIENTFNNGYQQAEKDLELTWEDIEKIDDITLRLDASAESRGMSNQEFYQEVLKRIKERKEKCQ